MDSLQNYNGSVAKRILWVRSEACARPWIGSLAHRHQRHETLRIDATRLLGKSGQKKFGCHRSRNSVSKVIPEEIWRLNLRDNIGSEKVGRILWKRATVRWNRKLTTALVESYKQSLMKIPLVERQFHVCHSKSRNHRPEKNWREFFFLDTLRVWQGKSWNLKKKKKTRNDARTVSRGWTFLSSLKYNATSWLLRL